MTPMRTTYDSPTIVLHWLTAVLVILVFLLAMFWDDVPRTLGHLMVATHMSLGIMLAVVLAVRLVWRATRGAKLPSTGQFEWAAKALHHALYLLLPVQLALGVFLRWTQNHPLNVFGLLIASPFGIFSKATADFVDNIHDIAAWTLISLAGVHAAAALMHHFVLGDGVLRRMLPARRPR
jgi:cytochrome b561